MNIIILIEGLAKRGTPRAYGHDRVMALPRPSNTFKFCESSPIPKGCQHVRGVLRRAVLAGLICM